MVEVKVRQEGKEVEGEVYIGKNHIPIQKALDYVNTHGGGKVFIEAGTYKINNVANTGEAGDGYKSIRVYSNTELCGEGINTILEGNYSDTDNYPSTVSMLSAKNAKIHDIKITKGYCGIVVRKCFNVSAYNCIVDSTGYSGIHVFDTYNSTVDSNMINNTKNIGINLNTSGNNVITSNTCNNNVDKGICLGFASNNTISGNVCNKNELGIFMSNSNRNTVVGNSCNNNRNGSGVLVNSSSNNNLVNGNICTSNGYYGVNINKNSCSNVVASNVCHSNSRNGVSIEDNDSNDNTVASNVGTISDSGHSTALYSNFT